MQAIRRKAKGWGLFAKPLLAIVGLVGAYVLLVQWQDLPNLFDSAFSAVRWPIIG